MASQSRSGDPTAGGLDPTVLNSGTGFYLEDLYEAYLVDPRTVPAEYARIFAGLGAVDSAIARRPIEADLLRSARTVRIAQGAQSETSGSVWARWVQAYRSRGHWAARLDPLGLTRPASPPDLDPAFHGIGPAELQSEIPSGLVSGEATRTGADLLSVLNATYCGAIGSEYQHLMNVEERRFICDRLETTRGQFTLSREERLRIFTELTAAEGLEHFLHRRYIGQKRFSLEGSESLMPALNDLVRQASAGPVEEIVIGMAHRGRLNVLVNLLAKPLPELFSAFEGRYDPLHQNGSGDVKYHLGFSSDVTLGKRVLHLTLAFNPSHLEIVDPVVEGSVRARQDRLGDRAGDRVLPVLIHGDASLAGQGVVMETLEMAETRGFRTGGTLHFVVNNQIGFTISNPRDARSTRYATDIAKMIEAPVFHVNADDVEAVIFALRIAFEYRSRFHKDVFLDLVGYRRHGHNEADEPAVTQPLMYASIREHPTVRAIYERQLLEGGVIDSTQSEQLAGAYRDGLDRGEVPVSFILPRAEARPPLVDWEPYRGERWDRPVETWVKKADLLRLGQMLVTLPEGWTVHPRLARILEERRKMLLGEVPFDWGMAELLAYASLLVQGHPVRLSGQDSARGTFFHRHAVLHDVATDATDVALNRLAPKQALADIVDSFLSEEGVLAFEYGYATANPDALVIWEAQYGDFGNGAQVVVDQFLSAGEAKWGRLCGLVLFLPHGQEGAGPEHSSARPERYLQLCAEDNLQIANPTTPAQMFHLIRRQVIRPYRKPLVVLTPKSLLRHRLAVSDWKDLTDGGFRPVLDEPEMQDPSQIRRVILTSGKLYYELFETREAAGRGDVALVRLEQWYPLPDAMLKAALARYPRAEDVIWCQEEPENQGAWQALAPRLSPLLAPNQSLRYVGRPASAATAPGYAALHTIQQKAILEAALAAAPSGSIRKRPSTRSKSLPETA
ncbi:MAG: 2-oxoglutarate dehydrogenase E1 component [Gammaproteobacteria bacterium]